ncbi:MAG: hypothetical protein J5871_00160 [Bacteroidales bacterium]|nr:hypothetical protein [Bacteroidales bacterium]
MKTKLIQLSLMAACIIAAAVSCQKETELPSPGGEAYEIEMLPDLEELKTYLGESSGNPAVFWGTNEYVTMWYNDGSDRFSRSLNESADDKNGKLEGTFRFSVSPAAASSYRFGGYYPSSAVSGPSGSKVVMTLPAIQNATAGNYDPSAFLLVAKPGNGTSLPNPMHITFRRATALNEVTITQVPETVSSVTITAKGYKLAGGRSINLATGESEDSYTDASESVTVRFASAQPAGTLKLLFTSWGLNLPKGGQLRFRVDCPSGKWYKFGITAGTNGLVLAENGLNRLSMSMSGATQRPTKAEAFAEAFASELDTWKNTSGAITDLAGNNPADDAASSTGHYIPHDITITANGTTYTKAQAFYVAATLLRNLWDGKTFFNASLASSPRRCNWAQQSFKEAETFTATTVKADLLTAEDSGHIDRQLSYRTSSSSRAFANFCGDSSNPAGYTDIGDCSLERTNLILARIFRYLLDEEITSGIATALANVPFSASCFEDDGTPETPVTPDPPTPSSTTLKRFAQQFVTCLDVWQNTIGEVDSDGSHFSGSAWTNVHLLPIDPATVNNPGYTRDGNQYDSKYAPFWTATVDGVTYTAAQCWEIALRGIMDLTTTQGADGLQNHTDPNAATFTAGNGKSFSSATISRGSVANLKWGAYPWYEQDEPVTLGGANVNSVGLSFLHKALAWHYVRAVVTNSGNTPLGQIGNFQYFGTAEGKLLLQENGQTYSGYISPMRELLVMARFYKYLLDKNLDSNIYTATKDVRFNYALYETGISLSASSLSFTSAGGSKTVSLNADESWTASSSASWITVTPASGSQGDNQTVTIKASSTASARSGSVTFKSSSGSATLSVSQHGDEIDDETILAMVRTDVQNTAYYKDLFLDGGCELNPGIKENGVVVNGRLPYAMDKTGITNAEYFLSTIDDVNNGYIASDKTLQTNIISGTSTDLNGVLLYPDGEPRFRMIYVFGGHSGPHGTTLGETGRARVNTFYTNGGSYVGSCAGAYLAGRYATGSALAYFNIWKDGNMKGTGISNSSIDIKMVSNVFASYYGPANGVTVTGARHNGGGYMDVNSGPAGTEIIARFMNQTGKNTSSQGFYNQPGVWAYKASKTSGRLVVTGSHPEDAASGDILNLTSSMFKYAWDGSGNAKVKGVLHNGEARAMTKGTSDNQPAYTGIGDLQCHHFVCYLPQAVSSMTIKLAGSGSYNLQLYLKKDSFAFPGSSPDYQSTASGVSKTLTTGALSAGLWYVTVRCATTVTSKEVTTNTSTNKGRYFTYSGSTGVLNGVPYTITASWQ